MFWTQNSEAVSSQILGFKDMRKSKIGPLEQIFSWKLLWDNFFWCTLYTVQLGNTVIGKTVDTDTEDADSN